MISIAQLWELIDKHACRLPEREVSLIEALGCTLAAPVISPVDLPAFDGSAMDGYAFAETAPGTCAVVTQVAAGAVPDEPIAPGLAARIFTGAEIPPGTVCVARQEDCLAGEGTVSLRPGLGGLLAGDNIRPRGGVACAGTALIGSGTLITPGGIALAASCGICSLRVIPHPAAMHIATGSELAESGRPPERGMIFDSNGPMMEALLHVSGIPIERRRIADSCEQLARAILKFSGDLLLISGGSGPGDHDHTAAALRAEGFEIHSSRVNSRPGRPLIFATRGNQVAFGLPGNPLAQWTCHHAFVRRAIARQMGLPPLALRRLPFSMPVTERVPTWTPAVCSTEPDPPAIHPLPWKDSGDLTPLVAANALVLSDPPGILIL